MTRAWVNDAACFDLPTEVFFFEKGEGAGEASQLVIATCNGCPVKQQCLDEAMELEADTSSHRFGIWGGKTPNQRKRLWRKMNGKQDQKPSIDRFCGYGHVLDESNAYVRSDGCLECRTCRREKRKIKRHQLAASG